MIRLLQPRLKGFSLSLHGLEICKRFLIYRLGFKPWHCCSTTGWLLEDLSGFCRKRKDNTFSISFKHTKGLYLLWIVIVIILVYDFCLDLNKSSWSGLSLDICYKRPYATMLITFRLCLVLFTILFLIYIYI